MARRSLYVFTAEMALKIVAQGFVLNRGAYLRDVGAAQSRAPANM